VRLLLTDLVLAAVDLHLSETEEETKETEAAQAPREGVEIGVLMVGRTLEIMLVTDWERIADLMEGDLARDHLLLITDAGNKSWMNLIK
jgi:hypothetical protein